MTPLLFHVQNLYKTAEMGEIHEKYDSLLSVTCRFQILYLNRGSNPCRGAKFQNPSLDSKPSTVGLFIGIGVTHPEKTLKLVKLSNNFLMHAIDFGYQRR